MSSWRLQRQVVIFSIYFILACLPFVIFAFFILQKSDTCFDGVKNQDEQGIDCNGVCSLQCKGSYKEVKVKFAKGTVANVDNYNIFAELENPNSNISFAKIPYTIKAYNKDAGLLISASGTASILANSKSAIYLPNLKMKQFPSIVDINLGDYDGVKDLDSNFTENVRSGAWSVRRGANNSLQLIGKIINNSNKEFYAFEVYAMLYDDTRSVYAVGKTVISGIKGKGETAVTFSWGDLKEPANVDFIITQNQI